MKIFKTTLVLAIVALVCGLIIGGAQAITVGIIEDNAKERALASYREIYPDLDSQYTESIDIEEGTVYQVVVVKNSNNKLEGYIFRAKDNNQFGLVDIIVVVDPDGKIKNVKILATGNTPGFYDKHEDDDGNVKTVKGNNISNLTGADILAGEASKTGGSLDKMLKGVKKVAPDYMTVEDIPDVDNYKELFGEYGEVVVDDTFTTNEIVTKKEIIKDAEGNQIGYAYTASKITDIPYQPNAVLELLVGISNDGKILGIIELVNEHTQGETFYLQYKDTVAGIKDIDVKDLTIDKVAGATTSYNVLIEIFNAIKAAEDQDIYADLFGEYEEKIEDDSFVPNDTIIKKELIKDANGNTIGVAYTGTGTASIPGNPEAVLTILVAVSNEGKVLGIIELVNQHTQNQDGKYYLNYKDTVAGIKNIDVKDLKIDKVANASESHRVLTEIFNAIKEAEGL